MFRCCSIRLGTQPTEEVSVINSTQIVLLSTGELVKLRFLGNSWENTKNSFPIVIDSIVRRITLLGRLGLENLNIQRCSQKDLRLRLAEKINSD